MGYSFEFRGSALCQIGDDVSGGYYLEDESGNLIRETATKLRQDDEHAPNGDYQEVSN